MQRMRSAKALLQGYLDDKNWREHLPEIAQGGVTSVGPLFSFLLKEPTCMHRSAVALGATCALLAERDRERARNVVRRYMWHLSEESGNIGWGIPEAFAETLAASPILASEFGRILVTYIIDLGREDNYCDNDMLRRSCYWACGRYAAASPLATTTWGKWLARGLVDNDIICRGMAAWALSYFPFDPAWREHIEALLDRPEECLLFDGDNVYIQTVGELAKALLPVS